MEHKNQHYVPRSYLSAWCDPDSPENQEPYVWTFPREGGVGRRKAPKNLFAETEMYTIRLPDGRRSLALEHGLADLEGRFAQVRRDVVDRRADPTDEDHTIIRLFMAAAEARTKGRRDDLANHCGSALARLEELDAMYRAASPARQEAIAAASALGSSESGLSIDEVRVFAEAPLQHMMLPLIEVQCESYALMDMTILCTTSEPGFITSDRPCVWFDPDVRKRPFPYNAVGLSYPTVEVTLPLSPRALALLMWRPLREGHVYVDVPERIVDELNRRTRWNCEERFVVQRDVLREIWLDPGSAGSDSETSVRAALRAIRHHRRRGVGMAQRTTGGRVRGSARPRHRTLDRRLRSTGDGRSVANGTFVDRVDSRVAAHRDRRRDCALSSDRHHRDERSRERRHREWPTRCDEREARPPWAIG